MNLKPWATVPAYDVVHEEGGGGIIGVDLRGHHGPDVVDLALALLADDELEADGPRGFDVTLCWRRTIPNNNGDGWLSYHYYGHASRGATPVTQILDDHPTTHWCINHPHEAAQTGIPASSVVDGAQIIAAGLAAIEGQIEPHPTVEAPVEHRGAWRSTDSYLDSGYIYMCRECSTAFHERERVARAEAWEQYKAEHPDEYPAAVTS